MADNPRGDVLLPFPVNDEELWMFKAKGVPIPFPNMLVSRESARNELVVPSDV